MPLTGNLIFEIYISLDSRIDLMNSIVATVNNYKKEKKSSSSYIEKIKTHSASSGNVWSERKEFIIVNMDFLSAAESIQEAYESNEESGDDENGSQPTK